MDSRKSVKALLAQIFFPRRCPFCGKVVQAAERCCQSCLPELPFVEQAAHCPKCGKRECVCGEEALLAMTRSCFYHEGPAREAVLQMKFYHHPGYARTLAEFLAELLSDPSCWDVIVPVPMTAKKQKRRGYNQAALLSRFLSEKTGIPVKALLTKTRETRPQHELDSEERQKNLAGAYCGLEEAAGLRVLVCDDVLTTGSTLREAARALLAAGAREVGALTVNCTKAG